MMGVGFKISGDTSQKGKIVKILAVRYGVSIAVAAALYFLCLFLWNTVRLWQSCP